jgi:hypothetical protein
MEFLWDLAGTTFSFLEDAFDYIFSLFSTLSEGTRKRLLETHGYLGAFALFIFLRPAYDQLDRMEDHVLWADEKVIDTCRQTYMQECNMSAIAVCHLLNRNISDHTLTNHLFVRVLLSPKSLSHHSFFLISVPHIGSRGRPFS